MLFTFLSSQRRNWMHLLCCVAVQPTTKCELIKNALSWAFGLGLIGLKDWKFKSVFVHYSGLELDELNKFIALLQPFHVDSHSGKCVSLALAFRLKCGLTQGKGNRAEMEERYEVKSVLGLPWPIRTSWHSNFRWK